MSTFVKHFLFIINVFKSTFRVLPGRNGKEAWAEYKKPSGGRPEGLRGLNAM